MLNMTATGITIKKDKDINTENPMHIAAVKLTNGNENRLFMVRDLFDYLTKNPEEKIYVGATGHCLMPVTASNGTPYVRTAGNICTQDLLMGLPRERAI